MDKIDKLIEDCVEAAYMRSVSTGEGIADCDRMYNSAVNKIKKKVYRTKTKRKEKKRRDKIQRLLQASRDLVELVQQYEAAGKMPQQLGGL
jgi:hypothetical protein